MVIFYSLQKSSDLFFLQETWIKSLFFFFHALQPYVDYGYLHYMAPYGLSWALDFQLITKMCCASCWTSSIHLSLGLPLAVFPSTFLNLVTFEVSCHMTRPSNQKLLNLNNCFYYFTQMCVGFLRTSKRQKVARKKKFKPSSQW